nr:Lrp/AsnC family transcriptional regulator [Agathobacter ruminis]
MRETIDNVDEKIIAMMQDNARVAIKDIAAEVYMSSPAVASRIERLEKNGIINGYHAQVNMESIGYRIKAFINLDMEPMQKKDFYPFAQQCKNIVECNCVTGEYSILLEVAFHDTLELDLFINDLQRFGKTKTQIVFSTAVEHRIPPMEKIKKP